MSEAALRLPLARLPGLADRDARAVEGAWSWLLARGMALGAARRRRQAFAAATAAAVLAPDLEAMDDAALATEAATLGGALRREGLRAAHVVRVLALVREACRRERGLTPFVQQLAGGHALLHGAVIEMDTGEGKTLTALIAAASFGLAGRAVHVVTSNDYLAERDHDTLRPVLERLGLSVGLVVHGVEPPDRRAAYDRDVVFVSNKEVAFDHLRDRLLAGDPVGDPTLALKARRVLARGDDPAQPVQRCLDVAIIDEADSVLVDDAGTPLLISSAAGAPLPPEVALRALNLARELVERRHYAIDQHGIGIELTQAGEEAVVEAVRGLGGDWAVRVRRNEIMRAALTALHRLERDRHYIVRDGKVIIVDENTGRSMPDRFWAQDLQQMVEAKEACEPSGQRRSLASISFQRFFRRYATLCGMSGTVAEVSVELARVYGMGPSRIPRRLPLRRETPAPLLFETRDELWAWAAAEAARYQQRGQPVLLGTRTVAEAERASLALGRAGVVHVVLSAAQDAQEAEIIARAGQHGAVTVATNMAGRGTDILLGPGVAELGGLVVMLSERHDSRRVDRQLMGRCARQGDPGLALELLSFEDRILMLAEPWLRHLLTGAALRRWPALRRRLAIFAFDQAQARGEAEHARRRLDLVRRDEQMHKLLGFAGGLD